MKMKSMFWAGPAACLVVLLWTLSQSPRIAWGDDKAASPSKSNAPAHIDNNAAQIDSVNNEMFDGKIVTVYLDDPLDGSGQVMEEAKLHRIGDRWILMGKGVETGQPGEWDAGLTAGVPWDQVTSFYLFTPEQFNDRIKDGEF